jgi:hypothetical protein
MHVLISLSSVAVKALMMMLIGQGIVVADVGTADALAGLAWKK